MIRVATIALAATLLAACSPPKAPEEERRPEPQAQAQAGAQPHSAIVETADAYKERARSAEAQQSDAEDQQRAAVDAATE